jgi:hypothetical protein
MKIGQTISKVNSYFRKTLSWAAVVVVFGWWMLTLYGTVANPYTTTSQVLVALFLTTAHMVVVIYACAGLSETVRRRMQ